MVELKKTFQILQIVSMDVAFIQILVFLYYYFYFRYLFFFLLDTQSTHKKEPSHCDVSQNQSCLALSMLVRQVRVCIRYNLISVLMYYTFEFPYFTAFSFHVSNYKVPLPVAKTFPCHCRVLTRNCNSFLPRIVCNCFETCFKLPVGVMCNFMICQN